MFLVTLTFTEHKTQAARHMDGHKAWLQRGFDDGVFLLAGSLESGQGGAVMAHNATLEELQRRVDDDPFVAENIVRPEIVAFTPSRADDRLDFLLA